MEAAGPLVIFVNRARGPYTGREPRVAVRVMASLAGVTLVPEGKPWMMVSGRDFDEAVRELIKRLNEADDRLGIHRSYVLEFHYR
ncbi:MAG: hypothetical protein ACP5ID_02930 [Conexivisphaera sp.]